MGPKFKWDMFVTSFIPLWISIIVIDIWGIIDYSIANWNKCNSTFENLMELLYGNLLLVMTIITIVVLVISSMMNIKKFLKERNADAHKPKGKIVVARRANKLSSEFLLAYILPMIAFDFGDIKNIVLFVIYFAVLAILCIRNNNVYTNIYLEFLGYKMYDCDIECKVMESTHNYTNSLIISPNDLTTAIDNEIPYWDFENYIYIILCDEEGENE